MTELDRYETDAENGEIGVKSDDYTGYTRFVRKLRGEYSKPRDAPSLLQQCIAEAFGTAVIVFTGVGVVNAAVFTGAQSGLWQVAVVWGFGVTLAILTTNAVSGAHLNPAVTFAFALLRPEDFSFKKVPIYWAGQMLGGVLGSFLNYIIYGTVIDKFEMLRGIKRGEPESVRSAMAFGEYFANPEFQYSTSTSDPLGDGGLGWTDNTISIGGSFGIEAWGTAFLMLVILAVTDDRNSGFVRKEMAPYFIGFTVATLISLYAPLNQAGFNPARDFGPRLVSAMLGWGKIAIPGPKNGFWTYIFGPLFGAPLGGAFYDFVLRPPILKNKED